MTNTLTLSQAVAQHFDIDDVPEFNQTKPLDQAVAFLAKNKIDAEFLRGSLRTGVAVVTFGGNAQYIVIDKKGDEFLIAGSTLIGTLTAKKTVKRAKSAKKSQKTAETVENTDESTADEPTEPVVDDTAESE